ncbi:MAG: S8 family serine peptidase, partial [Clostridia bacterium]|nr:S8 family serine peptidase [Clostridia bacterium]
SSGKYAGVAPKSNIIAIKALDSGGEANATKILEAMQWIYENAMRFNIKVVCMSFGSEPLGAHDPIMQGAEKLWDKGIIVVAAAGNSGPEYSTIKSPGVSPKIITVGAFDDNRLDNTTFDPAFFEIAQFSSRGPAFDGFKPDLVAPAVDITSCGVEENYTTLSGTSVASPMIAGICALLVEQNPTSSPNQIKNNLLALCRPITFNQNKEGNGYFSFHNAKSPLE